MFDVTLNDTLTRLEAMQATISRRMEKPAATAADGSANAAILDAVTRAGNIAREYSVFAETHAMTGPIPSTRAEAMRETITTFRAAPEIMEKLLADLDTAMKSNGTLSPLFAKKVSHDYEGLKSIKDSLDTVWGEAVLHIAGRERAGKALRLVKPEPGKTP